MPLAPQEIRTFFTTSVTANRRRLFQTERSAELLLRILQDNRQKGRFKLHSYVIMPDHIHLLLTPAENVSLEKAMQFIKGRFSFHLKSAFDVWERSFKEHRIKDDLDYTHHLHYIEQNPVRANLSPTAEQFPYSSASSQQIDPKPLYFTQHSSRISSPTDGSVELQPHK
jgi:putative transposase